MKLILSILSICLLSVNAWASERTYLGVSTVKTNEAISSQLDLEENIGHTVLSVITDGPAYKAGLQKNDIITKVNDRSIKNFANLEQIIAAIYDEEEIEITYFRKGKENSLKVKLESKEYTDPIVTTLAGQGNVPNINVNDILKQLKQGGAMSNVSGIAMSTTMIDGEHSISVSGDSKKRHVEVKNTSSGEVEFKGDIIDEDYSKVPEDIRGKVKRATKMLGGIKMPNNAMKLFGGGNAPKAKDDSREKVDDFIKELEEESAKEGK